MSDPLPDRSESAHAKRVDRPGLSFWDDELLHVWECPHVLRLFGGNPDYIRCGFLSTGPGHCPYDHGERVELVEIVAVVLCRDCGESIMRSDSRTPDGRLICGSCSMGYVGKEAPRSSDDPRLAPLDPGGEDRPHGTQT